MIERQTKELNHEKTTKEAPRHWGFYQPTVMVESQSAPVLYGDPIEQAYMRGFVLASDSDLVVTDFELNQTYLENYLKNTLGFFLPEFMLVEDRGGNCLSENILKNPQALNRILEWAAEREGAQIQFFNVTEREIPLQNALAIESTSGDLENTLKIGSKPGFRQFCEQNGLPVPRGFICSDVQETASAVEELFMDSERVLIKAEDGTGGNDLMSNVVLFRDRWLEDGDTYLHKRMEQIQEFLGERWVAEEFVEGPEGSIHVYIHDEESCEDPFVLGALSENTSYIGGYWPYRYNGNDEYMVSLVRDILVPRLQELGVYGYHCIDFKGNNFLEDNARHGALDFIYGMIERIAQNHFPNEQYHWWHSHVELSRACSFEEIWHSYEELLRPSRNPGKFAVITNPEVLPHGRALDLTGVSFGKDSSLEGARIYFQQVAETIVDNFN